MDPTGWTALAEALAADVRRVSDRLRHLSQAQLAAPAGPLPPGIAGHPDASRAAAGRAAAQALADTAAALDSAAAGGAPEWRPLPVLADFAVGDQVAVAGHDLLAALDRVAPDTRVWTAANPPISPGSTAADAVDHAARLLADVRRRL